MVSSLFSVYLGSHNLLNSLPTNHISALCVLQTIWLIYDSVCCVNPEHWAQLTMGKYIVET